MPVSQPAPALQQTAGRRVVSVRADRPTQAKARSSGQLPCHPRRERGRPGADSAQHEFPDMVPIGWLVKGTSTILPTLAKEGARASAWVVV